MSPDKQHLSLSDASLALLKRTRGCQMDMLCADNMIIDQGAGETAMMPELFIYLGGEPGTLRCSLTQTSSEGFPVIQALTLNSTAGDAAHHGRWLLPAWFIIRKTEVWAERVIDDAGADTRESISENTLLITSESGEEILIRPDHPGPGFLLSTDPAEIEEVLGSGRYFMKHLLD